jgi:ADP-heptose:LPS heptosyltransferase
MMITSRYRRSAETRIDAEVTASDRIASGRDPVRRIVVVRPNHRLGNVVLLTPLICELEEMFPDAEIELLTAGRAAREVFARFRQVSAVHAGPAQSFRHPVEMIRVLMMLRKRTFDLAVDPDPRSRGGRFLLTQVRARHRVGFRWGVSHRDRILTHSAEASAAPLHHAQAPVYLLRAAYGFRKEQESAAPLAAPLLTLRLTDAERREGAEQLAAALGGMHVAAGRCIGIYAHATGAKSYSAEWWRRVIVAVRRHAPDVQLVEFVPHDGRPRLGGDPAALFDTDLRRLGATLAATSLVVSGDCGIMHLASASGARVLGLFKTTEPSRYAPYGASNEGIRVSDEDPESVVDRVGAALGFLARR